MPPSDGYIQAIGLFPLRNQAYAKTPRAKMNAATPCFTWTAATPASYPGMNVGNDPAGVTQYMIAIATKTMPSRTEMPTIVFFFMRILI